MIEKESKCRLLLYLLFFTSVDTFLFGTNINRSFLYVPRIVALLLIVVLLGFNKRISITRMNQRMVSIYFVMLGCMLITSLYYKEDFGTAISRILMLSVSFVIGLLVDKELYMTVFTKFVAIVSVFSFFTFIAALLFPSVLYMLPSVENSVHTVAHTYFFGTITEQTIITQIPRVAGVFWEPGAFATYLNFAIAIELFYKEQLNVRRIIIFVSALVLTLSTAGFISFGVLLLAFLVDGRSDQVSKRAKILLLLCVLTTILLAYMMDYSEMLYGVFGKLTSGTSSATTRYSSFFNGIKVAFQHPIIGVGNDYRSYMADIVQQSQYRNGGLIITNTIVGHYVNYGFLFGTLFLIGSCSFFMSLSKKPIVRLLLCGFVILVYFGEKFYSFMPFVFMFYAYGESRMQNVINCYN